MRKVIILSGLIILIAAAAIFGYFQYSSKQVQPVIQRFETKQNPAYKAVPQKSPLIIEIKNQEGFLTALKGENSAFSELRKIPEFEHVFSNIHKFKDFVSSRKGILDLLKDKSIIISVNPSGKNQLSLLFLCQFNDQNLAEMATGIVSQELGPAYTINQKNYDKTFIFNAKSENESFYFTCTNDIFMISEDFILIEEAIRHSNSQNLLTNKEFTESYKTIEESAVANIFINHQTIQQILSKMVSPEIRKTIGQIASYSDWSELDLSIGKSDLRFDGYSITRDSSDHYLNIFKNQEAEKLNIDEVIPSNVSYFVALNLKNTSTFIDQYENYLRAKGNFYPREMSLIEFEKKTKTNAAKLIKEIGGTQFAGVFTNINKSNPLQNRFFVAEILNQSDAKTKLGKAVADYAKTSNADASNLHFKYAADHKNSFDIYKLPIANMAESLFGKAFSGINTEYFVLLKNHLICGDNLPGLKSYIQSVVSGKVIANDSIYKVQNIEVLENSNFYLYSKIPKIFRLIDILLKPEVNKMLSDNEDILRKYSTFSWSFQVSDDQVKNRICLNYDPNQKEDPEAIWQLKLDGQLAQRPKMVLNHKDLPNREVIVNDNKNNVSLINKEGLVLWTINIPGEIKSEIFQIDIYQTKRFQYLFNTKTQLYVIDRNGNKVGKFPVTLKSIASNGVSVTEYGNNRELRYFVAGEDKKIYVFDRDGKLIPNWKFEGSESMVTQTIHHYDLDGKDYLVFNDKRNTYFLDRQGKNRVSDPRPFDHSNNETYFIKGSDPKLISTDLSGKIYIQDFTGQQEIMDLGKFSSIHRFAAEDIDENGTVEYLFADGKKLTVFANNGNKLFEHSFPDAISETPFVCTSGSGANKIGIVVKAENKVYLLEKNGSVTKGFPLEGNTIFNFGKFNDTNTWDNLIVGSDVNELINYRIE